MSKICAVGIAALLVGTLASVGQAADRATQQKAPVVPPAFPGLTRIYVASGVRDNAGAINTGVATSSHCTNWSASTQQIRYVVRNFDAAIVVNTQFNVLAKRTHTASTHGTVAFNEDAFLSTGTLIEQGSMVIFATSPHVTCSVSVIDASAAAPVGIDLHLVRSSPLSGTQE